MMLTYADFFRSASSVKSVVLLLRPPGYNEPGMAKKKPKHLRADFRKNRTAPPRAGDWTRKYQADDQASRTTCRSRSASAAKAI